MCPVCLTSLAITVAATTTTGGAATALALRVKRLLMNDRELETPAREEPHEHEQPHRHA